MSHLGIKSVDCACDLRYVNRPSNTASVQVMNFPQEILIKIFSLLPLSDKLQCNRVCRQWHWAFLTPGLHKDTTLKFSSVEAGGAGDRAFIENINRLSVKNPRGGLLETDLTDAIKSLILSKVEISIFSVRPIGDWNRLLGTLTHLTLDQGNPVDEFGFVSLLAACKELRSLKLMNCRELFLSGTLLASEKDQAKVKESLQHCSEFFYDGTYLTDVIFNRLTACMPNLRSLGIPNTRIINHLRGNGNSMSVFTFQNLIEFVASRSDTLCDLNFQNTALDSLNLQDIGRVKGLLVAKLNIANCSVNQEALLDFCRHQQKLSALDITNCRMILVDNPATRMCIFEELSPNLRHLSMRGLSAPKKFAECLAQLDHLESLDCSSCDIPSRHLAEGLCAAERETSTMKSLTLQSFSAAPENLALLVSSGLRNLVKLDLTNCHEAVTDLVLNKICSNMLFLKVLLLNNCSRLSDAGFTGALTEEVLAGVEMSMKNQTKEGKIFLGSRAEAQIVAEEKFRQKVAHDRAVMTNNQNPQGIDQLKFLKTLELNKVKLSEVSIQYSFGNFEDLRKIDLTLCTAIPASAFALLTRQNGHLEEILAKQTAIDDRCLLEMVKNCRRLRVLDVEGCKLVTDLSVRELPRMAEHLRVLNISFCKVKIESCDYIRLKMPMLRQLGTRGLELLQMLDEN